MLPFPVQRTSSEQQDFRVSGPLGYADYFYREGVNIILVRVTVAGSLSDLSDLPKPPVGTNLAGIADSHGSGSRTAIFDSVQAGHPLAKVSTRTSKQNQIYIFYPLHWRSSTRDSD
jgi:hypothetical protein